MRPKNEETKMQVYEFINDYLKTYRVSPTVREIAKGVGCSVSTAYKFLTRLQEEGLIDMSGKRNITSAVNNWAMDYAPIIGMVACGRPQLAVQDIQGYLPINKDIPRGILYFRVSRSPIFGSNTVPAGLDARKVRVVSQPWDGSYGAVPSGAASFYGNSRKNLLGFRTYRRCNYG